MSDGPVSDASDHVTIRVWVVPGSSRPGVAGLHGDRIKIRVSSPPERGRANSEVARLLAAAVGAEVELVGGMTSRSKLFRVEGVTAEEVSRKLGIRP